VKSTICDCSSNADAGMFYDEYPVAHDHELKHRRDGTLDGNIVAGNDEPPEDDRRVASLSDRRAVRPTEERLICRGWNLSICVQELRAPCLVDVLRRARTARAGDAGLWRRQPAAW
jgi:hypothetical protein